MEKATSKRELSQQYMQDYVKYLDEGKAKKDKENVRWFVDTFKEITKSGAIGLERYKPLQDAFIKKYMPELAEKKPPKAKADELIKELELLID